MSTNEHVLRAVLPNITAISLPNSIVDPGLNTYIDERMPILARHLSPSVSYMPRNIAGKCILLRGSFIIISGNHRKLQVKSPFSGFGMGCLASRTSRYRSFGRKAGR
jgi:hypothetical protein